MFKIKEDLLQAVVNYLAKRPYEESYRLIMALQQLEKVDDTVKQMNEE